MPTMCSRRSEARSSSSPATTYSFTQFGPFAPSNSFPHTNARASAPRILSYPAVLLHWRSQGDLFGRSARQAREKREERRYLEGHFLLRGSQSHRFRLQQFNAIAPGVEFYPSSQWQGRDLIGLTRL